MPPVSEYANRLRVERTRLRLSQAEVAEQSGLKQPDISLYERGLVPPTDHLVRLGAVFNVPAATILEWVREPAEEVA